MHNLCLGLSRNQFTFFTCFRLTNLRLPKKRTRLINYILTSNTAKAGSWAISGEISVNLLEANMSFVRSTISHHLSSSAQSSDTFFASGGTSKLTLHTLSGTFVSPRLERFNWPDLRAWRSKTSETSPVFSWADSRPNPGFLARLCMI